MKVVIRRRQPNESLPKQVREEAIKKLASIYVGRLPLSPLSTEETKRWLPELVGLPAEHPEFPRACQKFWAEMEIKVPFSGFELEVAQTEDGEPINLEHYLKYRFALAHPYCGKNEMDMKKNVLMTHYILDPEIEEIEKSKKTELAKLADKAFILDSDKPEKMQMILQVMSPNTSPENLSSKQLENVLYSMKNNQPATYYETSKDKNLEIKAEIYKLVNSGVITQIGNKFIYESEPLGTTLNETVAYFKDARNSKALLEMRSKLKELV